MLEQLFGGLTRTELNFQLLGNGPRRPYAPVMGIIDQDMCTQGGTENGSTALDNMYKYNLVTQQWSTLQPANNPAARWAASYGVIDGRLIIYGGFGGGSAIFNDLREYQPDKNTWASLGTGPSARTGAASLVIGDDLYIQGGSAGGSTRMRSALRYNRVENKWYTLANMPFGCNVHPATLLDGYIYSFGGLLDNGISNSLVRFNIATNSYQILTTGAGGPSGAYQSMLFAHQGKIHLFGGETSPNNVFNEWWVYDPVTNTWEKIGASPMGAKSGVAHHRVGNHLFVYGGRT